MRVKELARKTIRKKENSKPIVSISRIFRTEPSVVEASPAFVPVRPATIVSIRPPNETVQPNSGKYPTWLANLSNRI